MIKKEFILILLILLFLKSDWSVVKNINNANQSKYSDMEMAQLIRDDFSSENIYFIYEEYKYGTFYSRMQVFLKDVNMTVILPEDYDALDSGALVITYLASDFSVDLKKDKTANCLMESNTYSLFQKSD